MKTLLNHKKTRIGLKILIFLFIYQAIPNLKAKSDEALRSKKDWNFIVYVASSNDLNKFVKRNLEQMKQIGSNQRINILVQNDTYGKKEVCRYFIKKNNAVLMEKQTNKPESISGTPESLYQFAKWAITNYPATHTAIILWDHGSGIEDPSIWGRKWLDYPNDVLFINPKTGLLELNRKQLKERGIAFNDIFQTYLTNQDLKSTLKQICSSLLNGKKIDILGMDACNMNMLEVASQVKDCVNYMVGSEEVEPGTGWKYDAALKQFTHQSPTPEQFAKQIVQAYKEEYQFSYADYTQSALNLTKHGLLEENINDVSVCLLDILKSNKKSKFLKHLRKLRNSPRLTTVFANRNYIDMRHLYKSLLDKAESLEDEFNKHPSIMLLQTLLYEGLTIIKNEVTENATCTKLSNAGGLSIYFPTKKIHKSYPKTDFAKTNQWAIFLNKYIKETQYGSYYAYH